MTRYQDGSYAQQNPTWHSEDSPWKAGKILDMLRRRGLQPGCIVDVGCGAGGVLAELRRSLPPEAALHGYEVAPQAYQLCLERNLDGVSFHLDDFLAHPLPGVDLLLAIDLLEHVEDVFGFARRLCPLGEYKLFHFPLDFTALLLLRPAALMEKRRVVGHLHYFTRESVLALLEDTGYQVLDEAYTAWGIELEDHGAKKRTLNVLRRLVAAAGGPGTAARLLGGYSLLVLAK